MKKRKTYTQEFKHETVRLLETSDKSVSDLARELGIRRSLFYKWKEQFGKPGNGSPSNKENRSGSMDEVTLLKLELEQIKAENTILKKAMAYVAKDIE